MLYAPLVDDEPVLCLVVTSRDGWRAAGRFLIIIDDHLPGVIRCALTSRRAANCSGPHPRDLAYDDGRYRAATAYTLRSTIEWGIAALEKCAVPGGLARLH